MLSKNKQPSMTTQKKVFYPLLLLTLLLWIFYRFIFRFPVWFDESIGKAIFFGFPVWLYLSMTQLDSIMDSISPKKLHKGLLLGLAAGGVFGFVGSLIRVVIAGGAVQPVALFAASNFWYEFGLALLTGFWESLFFFGWIMSVIMIKYKKKSFIYQTLIVAFIFMVFHIPNSLLRFDLVMFLPQVLLMFLFGLGQAMIFYRWKNVYALSISHAIWGMVLLLHS